LVVEITTEVHPNISSMRRARAFPWLRPTARRTQGAPRRRRGAKPSAGERTVASGRDHGAWP